MVIITICMGGSRSTERERAVAVAQAIASLPLDQRETLVLRIWGGLTFAAIARALDENVDTVAGRPIEPGSRMRSRIAAQLAMQSHDSFQDTSRRTLAACGERLIWATGGAPAASLAFLIAGAAPSGREQPVVATVHDISLMPPAAASSPQVREEAIGWTDEGIRFMNTSTPTRVVRRKVIERHLAADGIAEVRVPREDMILLPVALR